MDCTPKVHRVPFALIALACTALLLALAVGMPSPARAATKLDGTVGPGPTISLSRGGSPVKSLPAGDYTIVVDDRADSHNFHLTGPGGIDEATTVPFVGTRSFDLTLEQGEYTYVCDPHAEGMRGSFMVTGARAGSLPFTGFDLRAVALLGGGLIGTGALALFAARNRGAAKR